MTKHPFINNKYNVTEKELRTLCKNLFLTKREIIHLYVLNRNVEFAGSKIGILNALDENLTTESGACYRLNKLIKKARKKKKLEK